MLLVEWRTIHHGEVIGIDTARRCDDSKSAKDATAHVGTLGILHDADLRQRGSQAGVLRLGVVLPSMFAGA